MLVRMASLLCLDCLRIWHAVLMGLCKRCCSTHFLNRRERRSEMLKQKQVSTPEQKTMRLGWSPGVPRAIRDIGTRCSMHAISHGCHCISSHQAEGSYQIAVRPSCLLQPKFFIRHHAPVHLILPGACHSNSNCIADQSIVTSEQTDGQQT